MSRWSSLLHTLLHPAIALSAAVVIAGAAIGLALTSSSVTPSGTYVAATYASLTATGGANSDLSFQAPGQIASINVTLGEKVIAGQALVSLDHSALFAQRAGAVAALEVAQAKLDAIKAGTRSEQLSVDETLVTQDQEALRDAMRTAYINADDAVHNKADQLFINPRTPSVAFAFAVPDQTLQNTVLTQRIALEAMLTAWGSEVNAPAFAAADPLTSAASAQTRLASVLAFLDNVAQVLAITPSSSLLTTTTLQGYQSSVTTGRLNVSGSVTAITSAKTALESAQGTLTLAKAGATEQDIAAAQAAVDAAQATVAGIDVALRQATISAPVAGTVTALNAHLGETVSPGQTIVSIQSAGGSSAHALVVPSTSVITDNGQSFVYVKSGASTVKTPITVGLVGDNGMTEITSGLTEGEQVLAFGTTSSH